MNAGTHSTRGFDHALHNARLIEAANCHTGPVRSTRRICYRRKKRIGGHSVGTCSGTRTRRRSGERRGREGCARANAACKHLGHSENRAQAITQTKRDAQSRVVSLLLDKNEEKPSTEAYRTLTDVQNSEGDLQVVDKVGVPDGI
jgi:hypothetical protein